MQACSDESKRALSLSASVLICVTKSAHEIVSLSLALFASCCLFPVIFSSLSLSLALVFPLCAGNVPSLVLVTRFLLFLAM